MMVCKTTKAETIHSQCDTFSDINSLFLAVSVLVLDLFVDYRVEILDGDVFVVAVAAVVGDDMAPHVEVLAVADTVEQGVGGDRLWTPMCDSITCLVSWSLMKNENVAWRLLVEWMMTIVAAVVDVAFVADACTDGSL